MKRENIFLTLLFALIILIPTFDAVFDFSPVKELFEKRLPVEKPQFPQNFSEAKAFPKNFEKYFNDNYGFRKTLILLNSRMMDNFFDESPDSRAVIGKDGWLYFDNYNSLLDAQGLVSLEDKKIERGVESFYRNWQKMREKNIKYLLVIAPDKTTIYPEFLPAYFKISESRRIDKFLAALWKKYPDFPLLDLRPVLKKAKEKEIVYQKTDTHWNRRGAHSAYVEIMKKLKIIPHSRSEFIEKSDEMIRGDIADIMSSDVQNLNYDLVPKFKENLIFILPTKEELEKFHNPIFVINKNKNLPVLFAYKDSFFADLTNFVSEHFSQSFYINEFPCDLNYETIKKYHPDVVIQEFWEGRVEEILQKCQTD